MKVKRYHLNENLMKDTKLTENESMLIIMQMIRNTQKKVENNFGRPFIICGYTALIISILIWFLYFFFGNSAVNWSYLWLLIPVISIAAGYPVNKSQIKEAKTYIDQVLQYVWYVTGLVSLTVGIISFIWFIPVFFLIPVLLSMGIILTGLIIRYRLIIICGLISSILSFTCLWINNQYQPLLFGGIFIIMMIIPGHAMNRKSKLSE